MEIYDPGFTIVFMLALFAAGLFLFLRAEDTRTQISNTFSDGSRTSRMMRRLYGVDSPHYVRSHQVGGLFVMLVAATFLGVMAVQWLLR